MFSHQKRVIDYYHCELYGWCLPAVGGYDLRAPKCPGVHHEYCVKAFALLLCFRYLSSSAIHVLYQSARQAATEAAPAAHVAVTAAAPEVAACPGVTGASGVGAGEKDAGCVYVCVCVCVCELEGRYWRIYACAEEYAAK